MLNGVDECFFVNDRQKLFELRGDREAKLSLRTLSWLVDLEVQHLGRDGRAAPAEDSKFDRFFDVGEIRAYSKNTRADVDSGDNVEEPDAFSNGRAEGYKKQEEP